MVTMKIDPEVYTNFRNLDLRTEDGIPLTTNSQKIAYLVSLYKKVRI